MRDDFQSLQPQAETLLQLLGRPSPNMQGMLLFSPEDVKTIHAFVTQFLRMCDEWKEVVTEANPPKKEAAASPPKKEEEVLKPKTVHFIVVVNGENVYLDIPIGTTMEEVRDQALRTSHNTGRSFAEWLVHDERGHILPLDGRISEKTKQGTFILLSHRIGSGG